jgi:uncharacterized protein
METIGSTVTFDRAKWKHTECASATGAAPLPSQLAWVETLHQLSLAGREVARQQGLSSAFTFWSKTNRAPRSQAVWIKFVTDHYGAHSIGTPNARILRKPQRNYGMTGRSVAERVATLVYHHTFAARRMPSPLYQRLLRGGEIELARLTGRDGEVRVGLASTLAFEQKQEGEWTLLVRDCDHHLLARMAFLIDADDGATPNILIGGLQGLPAGGDKTVIVRTTRALSGLRPKDVALVGVQAVARALGIDRIYAVANSTHVLAAEWTFSDSVISRDYDGFWIERGGIALADVGFTLPLPDYAARATATANPRIIDVHRAALTQQVQVALSAQSSAPPDAAGNAQS